VTTIQTKLAVLKWMVGINLVLTIVALWKVCQ